MKVAMFESANRGGGNVLVNLNAITYAEEYLEWLPHRQGNTTTTRISFVGGSVMVIGSVEELKRKMESDSNA